MQVSLVFMFNVVVFICEQTPPSAGSSVYLQPKDNIVNSKTK